MKQILYWKSHGFCLLSALLIFPCHAEVTLDGSLGGTSGALQGPNYAIQADMGVQRGGNLFHSFGDFNLNAAESATFNDVGVITPVENILSRVTGGRPSIIDGQIRTDFANSQPNLFFMNPAGVMFGPNASLDVQGSFHVTTANYLKLENQGVFHADLNEKTSLNIAQVTAFGFLDAEVGEITINKSQLAIQKGESLSLIGGNINYAGDGLDENNLFKSYLFAPSGRINLASVDSAGEVSLMQDNLDTTGFNQLGDITLSNGALLNSNGDGAGHIVIHGAQLTQDTSGIFSNNFGDSTGAEQGIDIALRQSLLINNGSSILSGTVAGGNAGNITIKAQEIGMRNGAQISADTYGQGNGGNLHINTRNLSLDGEGGSNFTGITVEAKSESMGNAGNLTIEAQQVEMHNGAEISASTFSNSRTSNAGNIKIEAERIILTSDDKYGGVFSQSGNPSPDIAWDAGDAGNITITGGTLQ